MPRTTKLLLFISSLFLIFIPAKGQEVSNARWLSRDTTVSKINVIAYWNKGEKKKYRAYKTTLKYENDSLTSERKEFDSIVEFAVTDSTANSYELTFRMLENKRDTSKDPTLPLELASLNSEDLALHYTTDENGAIQAYKNRENIVEKLDKLMQAITSTSQKNLKDKSEVEKKLVADAIAKLANGNMLFGSIYETFISQFHNFHGYSSGINDTLAYDEAQRHQLTNTMIKYDCSAYIASIDSLNEIRFDTEKYADMGEFLRDYSNYLDKNTAGAETNFRKETFLKELTNLNMKMETYITNYIDLNTGWPTFLKLSRSVITKDPRSDVLHTKEEIWALTNNLEDQ